MSKELAKRHDVHVFYPAHNKDKSYSINSFEVDGLEIHELNLSNMSFLEKVRGILDFEIYYKSKKVEDIFREVLDEINPDVIHFQHLINLSASLIEVAKSKNIPTVITLHDYWFICPTIHLLKRDYSICSGPDRDCKNCSECWNEKRAEQFANYLVRHHFPKKASKSALNLIFRLKNPLKKFENREEYMESLLLKVDKIIAPSKFLRNLFIEYGILGDKIIFSENGYDLSVFKGFKRNKEKDKFVFGFVGGVAKLKGVHVLVEAFNKVNNKDVELRIYGNYDPNSSYFRELKTKIKNTNIKFMGMFEDVEEPYSEIDVLVFPSIWYENCPLVLTEARITNTPVIASDVGAIPEFVKDKETGLLFKMGDPDDLYKKIHIIVKNSGLIEKFRENIIPIKGIEEQVNELENIYGDLINQQREDGMLMRELMNEKKEVENVILITVDSLRADHTSFMGYNRETTPNLDKLSKKSVILERVMSNGSYTPASFTSFFSSTYPLMYGGYERFSNMRTSVVEVLNENGFITAGFHSNPFLSKFYGYTKGFEVFEDFIPSEHDQKDYQSETFGKKAVMLLKKHPIIYEIAKQVVRNISFLKPDKPPYTDAYTINKNVIRWIKNNRNEKFFLWIHYMDVHFPYMPKSRYSKQFGNIPNKQMFKSVNEKITYNKANSVTDEELKTMINLYDAEIRYADEQIGLLLAKLEKLDLLSKTAIIVTADHGEEFLDHGGLGHGAKLYEELLHVPFLLYLPNIDKGVRIKNRVSLIDLAPTILDLLSINNPSSFLGKSLLPLVVGNEYNERAIISEMASERITPDNPLKIDYSIRKIAYIYGDWKYIYYEKTDDELYNLKNDPKETKNLLYEEKEKAEEFKSKILQHIAMEEKNMKILNERSKIKKKIKELKSEEEI